MNPLGPLSGKSFCTSISPWIITLDALSAFKTFPPRRNPRLRLASYLQDPDPKSSYNISLTVTLQGSGGTEAETICTTNFGTLYWTVRDLVAHQTVNGCNLNVGDILATGTISGFTPESHGCLMESAPSGGAKINKANGEVKRKTWLEDGDVIRITGIAGDGVGFGDCVGEVLQSS